MTAVKEKAYAKINLFLDVLSKREDGFHDIRTVMHTVSLCDEVTVFYTPRDKTSIRISVDGNRYLPQDARNLAYRAAELYLKKTAITASVEIKLIKRIPVAAGLAGGSADAAAVLRALNRINHKRLTDKALSELAGELGSDIPYCVFGKSALCEGRGENITRLPNASLGHFVVAVGNEHVSTPKAYTALDVAFSDFDGTVPTGGDERFEAIIASVKGGEINPDGFFNVFEAAVLPLCPGATEIKNRLIEYGARASLMSGSGPSVFGLFTSASEAEAAAEKLRAAGHRAFACCSV